jgi:hypothetical protein
MKEIGFKILFSAILSCSILSEMFAENHSADQHGISAGKSEVPGPGPVKELQSINRSDSSLKLKSGNRGLNILESLEGASISITNNSRKDDRDQDDREKEHVRKRGKFRGHWSGIEFGFNNYVTSGNSMVLPSDIDYMTLRSGKSSNFNINFAQLSLGLARHIGFVTGLGLNWNNYRFDGNNNIIQGNDGVIDELDPGAKLQKSKLATLFLNVPFMLEVQIPVDHNHLSIAAGPIAAVKLGSHTKMVFEDGHTVKSFRDFSLNMLRYGTTARVGYGNFQLYGTYYMTPLFHTGKGPGGYDLYPFEIGVAFTFNN